MSAESPFYGQLTSGDQLITIDNEQVLHINHDSVLDLVKAATKLTITVLRQPGLGNLVTLEATRASTDAPWG